MWIVAVSDPGAAPALEQTPGFTRDTLFVLFAVTIAGMPLGLLFVAVERWLPGRWTGKGIAFGSLLLLLVGLPVMLIEKEYSAGPPQLARALFAALFISYGLVTAWTNEWFLRRWRVTSPRRVAPITGALLLLVPGLIGLPIGLLVLGWH